MGKQVVKTTVKTLTHDEFYARLKQEKRRQQRKATVVAGVVLMVFLLLVFFVMPSNLPWAMQKAVALVNALLVGLVATFSFHEFGEKYRSFNLPLVKNISTGPVVGCLLGLLVLGWWSSPLAPIIAGTHGAEEVATLLGDEITLAVLVMADPMLAVIEPPLPPPQALAISTRIAADADIHSRLIRAIAERRFVEAEGLARRAEAAGVEPGLLAVARGQLAIYSGQYAEAPAHFDQAVAAGGDASVVAQQAVAYALNGDIARAYDIATRLVDDARSGALKGENAVGISLNLKAALAVTSGRFKEAIQLSEQSQSAWDDVEDSPHKAASRNNQGVVYAMLPKKYSGAETQFDGAMALWAELYGNDGLHVAGSRLNLAALDIARARYAAAESRLNQALQLARQNYPPDSAGIFPALNMLTRLHTTLGRFNVAQKYADEATRIVSQSAQLRMASLAARGVLLTAQGNYRDAAGSVVNAMELAAEVAVPEFVYLAEMQCQRAAISNLEAGNSPMISECQAAIKTFETQLGKNHPMVALGCNTLAESYLRAGKTSQAREQFQRAREIFKANEQEVHTPLELGVTLAGLADLYSRRERTQAVQNLREAVKIEVQALGPALGVGPDAALVETPRTADYLFDQAELFLQAGSSADYATAQQLFEQVVKIRERLLPRTHPALARTYQQYATLLEKMGKEEEAKAMEEKAEAARQRVAQHA